MHTTTTVFADVLTGGPSFADIKALPAPARASLRAALYLSTKTMDWKTPLCIAVLLCEADDLPH
jgi:hypothetical protein